MALFDEQRVLTKALSGFGIDEKPLVSVLGKWNAEQRKAYRKSVVPEMFIDDERQFEKWNGLHLLHLRQEFLRFMDAVVLYAMHPWERDARLLNEALVNGNGPLHDVIIETACTRSSNELLGAKRAYHSLFEHSIEDDIASYIPNPERKLFFALVSPYRYEGPIVDQDIAQSDALMFERAIRCSRNNILQDEDVLRVLTTSSKMHFKAIYEHYRLIRGKDLDKDLEAEFALKCAVQCLCTPHAYFSEVLGSSLRAEVNDTAVSRVIVTRAEADMKQIRQEYLRKYRFNLPNRIEELANGSYKDFLLTLVAKSDY
ncbi:annexin D4-like [Ipomoea triloba]|uniref:annexin D4-like n=1 Tax=Ipomoea triloba TaxID=35885 RepID=UPI00125D3B5F|nr:annexin D4-like [Ipomoea triloba]